MKEIQRLHHINLAVSSLNNTEFYPQCLAFYKDFLGMTGLNLAPGIRMLSHDDHVESTKAFGSIMELGDKEMDVAVWFLRGDDASPTASCLDFLSYNHPYLLTSPPEVAYEAGLRNVTLLVDNVDAIYARGLEQGIQFVSQPVTETLPNLGTVRFVVVIDPVGNQIELIQTDEIAELGAGNVVRLFSENINCIDVEKSLGFYRDVMGMQVITETNLDGASNIGTAMGIGEDISAKTYYLRGHAENAPTYLSLTGWLKPKTIVRERPEGVANSWFRLLLWAGVEDVVGGSLYQRSKDLVEYVAPPHHWADDSWGDSCFGIFYDYDGVLVELGYSSTWRSDFPGDSK